MEENVGLRGVASGSRSHELGLVGGDSSENSSSTDRREDCNIELQLGKRAFYGVGVKSSSASDSSSQSQSQSKRSRGGSASAPASPAPRCQVEGCREELTSAKDYHKRHKVCEAHSKTPQVRVNGISQRFCQQCSRFHELKEFDEGKRSCRRRLKGHNERRRKPQPYPTGLSSGRLPLPFHDNRYGSLFNDRPFLFHPSFGQTSVLQCLGEYKQDNCKRAWSRSLKSGDILTYESLNHQSFDQQPYTTPGKLLTFLPGSKSSYCDVNNQDYPQYIQSSESPVIEALSLSSPSGPVITGPIVTCSFQGLAGAANSSRALSLLSSQSWASRTSVSDSLNMATQAGIAIDQIMPDHQPHMDQTLIQQGLQPNYGLVEDKLLALNQQSLVSTEFSGNEGTSVGKGQNNAGFLASNSGMEPYEIRMPGLFQVPSISCHADANAQDLRCTINLMCRPSNTQTSESHLDAGGGQHGNIPFSVCESGRTYESSMFYPQHMM